MSSTLRIALAAVSGSLALFGLVVLLGGTNLFGGTNVEQPAEDSAANEPLYDPVRAGEQVPSGFRQLLPRDAIRPVYDPTFVSAADAQWDEDALVIGLEIDGDAKAYPVGYLDRREIVNDHVGKTPVLVTW